ncbi:MAG: glucosyl transferase family 2 [Caulobacter sp.]|nr:glucosyl transferase family 2 [Caulobacter sp.]
MDDLGKRDIYVSDRSFETYAATPVSSTPLSSDVPPDAPLAMPVRPLTDWRGAKAEAPASSPIDIVTRRFMVFGGGAVVAFLAWLATYNTIALGGVTRLEAICLVLLAPLFAALSLWFCTAVAGFVILLGKPRDPLGIDQTLPLPQPKGRVALLMPVHNEDAQAVFARLRAMDASLTEAGRADLFDIFVLSDTREPAIALAEQSHYVRFRREASCRVYYRLRVQNLGRKAGNVADWVRRFGAAYDAMIVLDADSLMTGDAMVRLADAMERHPDVGLIQTMPVLVNSQTVFARCLQFATSLYGRVAWTGLAWWSGSESSFWGHNAIIRVRAFAETCGLPILPGKRPFGGEVMSHDALESALLRRGGWGVHLAPYLEGSYEESPPNLLDFASRDRRWCRGNVQHIPLIGLPGLHWLSRMHLVIGVLSYVLSPLWFLALSAGVISRALLPNLKRAAFQWADVQAAAHAMVNWREIQATAWAMILTAILLFGPKVLGTILIFTRPSEVRAFGGRRRILAGLSVEMLMSALVAPMLMFTQTRALIEILAGRVGGWATQRRDTDRVTGSEAMRAMGWISLSGLGLAMAFWFTPDLLTATAPILAGLILAVPLTMLGASKAAGLKLKANGLFMTPEERRPPAIVRAALGSASDAPATWYVRAREPAALGVDHAVNQTAA